MASTETRTPCATWPVMSNRRPSITCSGRSVISAAGTVGVDVQLDPADAEAWREGRGTDPVMRRRRDPGHVEHETGLSHRNSPAPSAAGALEPCLRISPPCLDAP